MCVRVCLSVYLSVCLCLSVCHCIYVYNWTDRQIFGQTDREINTQVHTQTHTPKVRQNGRRGRVNLNKHVILRLTQIGRFLLELTTRWQQQQQQHFAPVSNTGFRTNYNASPARPTCHLPAKNKRSLNGHCVEKEATHRQSVVHLKQTIEK